MKKKPTAPAMPPTPEQQLERMKDLIRRVAAVPKSEAIKPKRPRKH